MFQQKLQNLSGNGEGGFRVSTNFFVIFTRAIDLPSVGLFRRKQAVYEPDLMLAEV
jgi:hypothetical protein